jgi:ribonuclease-3
LPVTQKQPIRSDSAPDPSLLEACQELIGYHFQRRELLVAALTHASGANSRVVSNERLEFLGDAVLGMVTCEHLYRLYPQLLEGELTKIKSIVVSRRTCARVSRVLGLERYLILGKGMASQAAIPLSVMADVFESLIGSIYLDGGLEAARAFVMRFIRPEIDKAAHGYHGGNYKSLLQQIAQRQLGVTPTYETLEEKGPDHSKQFKVAAVIGNERFPPAWGPNKKEAEQRAALNALNQLKGRDPTADVGIAPEAIGAEPAPLSSAPSRSR